MTTRETSRESYRQLVDSGQLVGKQALALDMTIRHGPGTSAEIIAHLPGDNVNLWRARFTELNARGLIREIGVRKCKVSGRSALVWEATGRTKPLDPDKGHITSGPKAWRALATKAVEILAASTIAGQNNANTNHLRAEQDRAIKEFGRLGGKLP